ncbi:MAG: tetratricopeptide repeat protein [bacterium]|nr:tetratricopeptide repeat protein [bacterium]
MTKSLLVLILVAVAVSGPLSCASVPQKKPDNIRSAEAYYQLGLEQMSSGNQQGALLEFRKAEATNPDDPRVYNAMGLVYAGLGRTDKAEEAYQKALRLKKDYSDVHLHLGVLYGSQNRCKEAIPHFEKALENPFFETPGKALHNIGLCYQLMGQVVEAEGKFKEALQLDPNLFRAYYDLGSLYYGENLLDQAIELLDRGIERYSRLEGARPHDLSRFHFLLGLCYFKYADRENAQRHFRQVTELAPGMSIDRDAQKYLELLQ